MNVINYIKAHIFHDVNSAVKLAEETKSKGNIKFAKKILHVKSLSKKSLNSDHDKIQNWNQRLNVLSSVNLYPNDSNPIDYYKSIHIQKTIASVKKQKTITLGYVSNFMGTNNPGLSIHGTAQGDSYFYNGLEKLQKDERGNNIYLGQCMPVDKLVDFLIEKRNLNELAADKRPLHFISCYSGKAENEQKRSMAQELANKLDKPVFSYGEHEPVYTVKQKHGLLEMLNNDGFIATIKNKQLVKIKPKLLIPEPKISGMLPTKTR